MKIHTLSSKLQVWIVLCIFLARVFSPALHTIHTMYKTTLDSLGRITSSKIFRGGENNQDGWLPLVSTHAFAPPFSQLFTHHSLGISYISCAMFNCMYLSIHPFHFVCNPDVYHLFIPLSLHRPSRTSLFLKTKHSNTRFPAIVGQPTSTNTYICIYTHLLWPFLSIFLSLSRFLFFSF